MKKKIENKLKKVLNNINLDQEISNYFLYAVDHCKKNNTYMLDIDLTNDIYPFLSSKSNLTPSAVEARMVKALKRSFETTNKSTYLTTLGYDKRITVKKLLIILLLIVEKEETTIVKKK